MLIHIDLVRHGETEANLAGRWQGQGDSPLTPTGRGQVRRLGERIGSRAYDLVVSSDLGRALGTAAAVTPDVEPEAAWREADIGTWEGLTTAEVMAAYPDQIGAWTTDDSVRLGGGETYAEMSGRVGEALDKLLARLDDGDRALVVTHGGVIGSLLAQTLGYRRIPGRRVLSRLANTSITTLAVSSDGTRQLIAFNDAHHLDGDLTDPSFGGPLLHLIRHGETEANRRGVWQGSTDGDLAPSGRQQADRLAQWHDVVSAVYSSPLRRAHDTAAAIARRHRAGHEVLPDLTEMDFGAWEDRAPADIASQWPEEWARIYAHGEDAPRGGTGETYAQVAARMDDAVTGVATRHDGERVAVVGHGGAIRAWVTSLLGIAFAERRRLAEPANTAISRLRFVDGRPVLVDYNLTPHLGG